MDIRNYISFISIAVVLSACATSPDKRDLAHEIEKVEAEQTQKTEGLPKRVMKTATLTTVRAAKGAADLTVDSAQMAAKVTVKGVKAGGSIIAGTGEAVAKGTRSTVRGIGHGVEYIFTAPAVNDAANPVGNKTIMDAALSPLSDFNIRKRERPEVLMRLEEENLYYISEAADCEWLDVRITELDDVLGADYDEKVTSSSALDKVGEAGKGATISGVASAVGTYIPGRSIARAVSGAKARQNRTREIYQKGVARRSYLKGVAMSEGCKEL